MATFNVTNNNQYGPGSLRQAILDANSTQTITFHIIDIQVPGTIELFSTLPEIVNSTNFIGLGKYTTVINTNGSVKVFHCVGANKTYSFSDLS